ncbi:MAG: hydroxyacid dehydrogenase [bacterium]|nr:hydroxyacid dehydrogenase [bacterium]MDE0352524.1 hydroxyacid dehydrogenase [bacterium]
MGYRIWFERRVTPELMPFVPPSVDMLGPGRDDDPPAGISTAQAAIAARLDYNDTLFDRAPDLLGVFRTGIGYDTVDLEAATRRGIAACNVPQGPTVPTAEHSVALLLAAAKQLVRSSERLREGMGNYYLRHEATELDGKTLGLVGYGRIARRVGAVGAALGMEVLAHDPYLPDEAFPPGVERARTLEELLGRSDAVSVHVPMSAGNYRMFNAGAFAAMKKGALLVNAARGGLVDHDALIDALDSGQLSAAGLDVTDPEPLRPDHPLLHHTDVIVTPHVASSTPEARERMFSTAVRQALMVLDGQQPPHLLNPDAWPGVLARLDGAR